jgi:AraC-like DNA-binding protein
MPPLALLMHHLYESPGCGAVVDLRALRREDVVLRRTRYAGVVVDERLLVEAFPTVNQVSRPLVVALLSGRMRCDTERGAEVFGPGDAIVLSDQTRYRPRYEDAVFLDLEWTRAVDSSPASREGEWSSRATFPLERAQSLVAGLDSPRPDAREVLREAMAFCRELPADLGNLDVDALEGGPSERDERLARALESQLRNLRTQATRAHLEDATGLSSRQLQREVGAFNARYGLNAGNWQDTRTRWRVQIAAVLLSIREKSVSAIAEEVGYRSSTELARAFARAGFRPPTEVRALLFA